MIEENITSLEIELISKNAKEECIPCEIQFRKLIENAPDGIAIVGTNGKFKYVSPSGKKIFGYDSEADIDIDPNESTHPEDLNKVVNTLNELVADPSLVATLQYRFLNSDGTWHWIESNFSNMLAEPGIEGFIINFRSIEERKKIEDKLVKNETLYSTLFNLSPAGIMLEDMDGNIVDFNNTYLTLTGYLRDELIGQNVRKIVPPEFLDEVDKNIARINSGETLIYEISTLRKDATRIEIELRETMITLPNGAKGIIVVANDISERKKIEEKLKMSDLVFNHSADMLCVAGYDGFFKVLNPAWSKTLGWSTEELLSRPWNDFVYPEDIAATNHIRTVLDDGREIFHFENRYKCKDGSLKWLDWNSFPYSEENLIFAVARDVTEKKKTEQALNERLELEKLISAISSRFINIQQESLDQEINNALCNIGKITNTDRSYLILLSEDGVTADNTHEWCKDGVEPQIDTFKGIPVSSFPWFMERLYRFETIHIPSVEDLPAEAGSEKELLNSLDIKSVVFVPLFSAERIIGVAGFDAVYEKKYWLDEDIILLKMVGEIFANAIDRIKFDNALRVSEKKYRTIFENVQDAYYETSLEGIILSVSPSIELISGGQYHQTDLIGKSMNDFYTDTEQRKQILSLLQQKGSVSDHEVYFKNKDGLPIACAISAKLYFDAQGRPAKIIGSLRNITDRKIAEEKLKKSEARLQYAQKIGKIGNWDWDIQSNELYWSDESKHISGNSSEDKITIEAFLDSVDPADIEFVKQSIDEALCRKKPYDIEMHIIRRDGVKIEIHTVAEVSYDDYGKPVRMFGTMQDITERKLAETEIRFQSHMLNTIGQAVVSTDLQGHITYWNKAAEIIYGWTVNEVTGHYVIDILPATLSEEQIKKIMRNLNERMVWSGEFSVKRKDGTLFPIFATASPVLSECGELIGIITTSMDITERINHLKMIEESSKQLRALSLKIEDLREEERTAIARELHDELGQLLTAIKIDLQTIANHPPAKKDLAATVNPVLNLVEESIISIRKLSSDLRPTVLDHLGLVSSMEWYISEQKKRLRIDFTFKKPKDIGKVPMKKTVPVFRVFQELLTNIARHAKASKVDVLMEVIDSNMKLIVSDNGVGMDTAAIENNKSLGILGMRERLNVIGGTLSYSSQPGKGTDAEVIVPFIYSDEIPNMAVVDH